MGRLQDSFKAYITDDATATSLDIGWNKTAYAAGGKIVGTGGATHTYTITNPGAETGDMTGWTARSGTGFEVYPDNPGGGLPARTGSWMFGGGNQAGMSSSQDITAIAGDITAAHIDSGKAMLKITYYAMSFNGNDRSYMYMQFWDGSPGSQITDTVNVVPPFGVGPAGSWEERQVFHLVPTGTRTIRLYMVGDREDGTYCNSHIDDISLDAFMVA